MIVILTLLSMNDMRKPNDPRELVLALLHRSTCSIQVAAVIADKWGIFAWAVNHSGFNGLGACAEREAIRRANKKRLEGATIYVASRRQRNMKAIMSKPCVKCQHMIDKRKLKVIYRHGKGT